MAAKEGYDVIIIDMCQALRGTASPRAFFARPDLLSRGTVVGRDESGNNYVVSLCFVLFHV